MGRYFDGSSPEAETMFERLIGYQFALTTLNETHTFGKKTGKQIQLKQSPVEILLVEGYLKIDQLKIKNWFPIPIENISQIDRVLDIPPSLFQLPYEKVKVTYLAGETEIPEEVSQAVQEIADLLHDEALKEWNLPLSQKTLDVIGRYKK